MKKIISYIFLVCVVFLFTACSGSPYRQVKPNETLESKDLSCIVPDMNWEVDKEYSTAEYNNKRHSLRLINFDENIQFSIYSYHYLGGGGFEEELFKKDGYYYDTDIDGQRAFDENDKETGVTYAKSWITYVNGLKCTGGVFSRGFGGSYYSGGVKFYGFACGYYDTTETKNDGKRILNVDYRYTHNTKKPQEAIKREQTIKQAVKKAISTLKIKNIDKERMEKEGLMHYDKEFKSTKW